MKTYHRLGARWSWLWSGLVLIVAGLVLAGWTAESAVADYNDWQTLHRTGMGISVKVTSIVETSRSGEALTVNAQLPDGRRIDVDLSDSKSFGANVGERIEIVADPTNLELNLPADVFAKRPNLALEILQTSVPMSLICVVGVVVAVNARSRRGRSDI
jgi:hypothetical protein